ncbi:hypothetical protein C1645_836408 [Glomus cerebriforme]|uniref:Uncharacterized protein n=1 Tax=Glomus cerebriforme TaxID=658196 RepID=A0A397S8H3_9GLOM|nr:hypothetical protein C1645_836408 [Glomus cerebriforme]
MLVIFLSFLTSASDLTFWTSKLKVLLGDTSKSLNTFQYEESSKSLDLTLMQDILNLAPINLSSPVSSQVSNISEEISNNNAVLDAILMDTASSNDPSLKKLKRR